MIVGEEDPPATREPAAREPGLPILILSMTSAWQDGRVRLIAATLSLCALAAVAAGPVLAHGDPASEYLVDHEIFFPLRKPLAQPDQARLTALVAEARRSGYPIRVALIGSRFDLGTEGDAWGKPAAYAAALDADIAYYYRGPLLVVMPAGLGLARPGGSAPQELRLLARIAVGRGPAGLAAAAERAVERLAASHGVEISAPRHVTTEAARNSHDRIVIALAAAAGLLVWQLVRLARRRAPAHS